MCSLTSGVFESALGDINAMLAEAFVYTNAMLARTEDTNPMLAGPKVDWKTWSTCPQLTSGQVVPNYIA